MFDVSESGKRSGLVEPVGVWAWGNVSVLNVFFRRSVAPAGAVPERIAWRDSSIALSAAIL